ncbi:MAG: SGNH/GDSL hydrolase family protein [Planctomycetaceae bacterium]
MPEYTFPPAYFLLLAVGVAVAVADSSVANENVHLRGSLENCRHRFSERQGHVAFLGGSITEMDGYRPIVENWLRNRFPETKFSFTNAGIASTCSQTGAFRLKRDVLDHGPVDLLLVEFAVNDDQDAHHSSDDCVRGMEGIVRQVRRHNPSADIVMIHFVNEAMLETIAAGKEPLSSAQHERVARHYDVSSVYLSREVADRIKAGTLTWQQYGGTHPGPVGNQLAADLVTGLLESGWTEAADNSPPKPHDVPDDFILTSSFADGRLLPFGAIRIVSGWEKSEPDWDRIAGSKRSRFLGIPLLHATQPGATVELSFHGTAVGAYVLAGPDAGRLEYQIDGGDWRQAELLHHYSKGLHYPRTVMFATGLDDDAHSVTVRVAESHHPDSTGFAARVLNFVVNGRDPDSE